MSEHDTGRDRAPLGDRPVWRERLGTYLLGVAIGLVLVGVLLWGRAQAIRGHPPPPAAAPSTTP